MKLQKRERRFSRMNVANIYGIPPATLVRWILEERFPSGVDLWIDIACGNGDFIREIGVIPKQGIGVDVNKEMPKLPQNFTFEREKANTWIHLNRGIIPTLVSSFEFIEHMEKNDATNFIQSVKQMAEFFILSTPSGFLRQDAETDASLAENPWQWHRCGFSSEELEGLGFSVFVLKNVHYKPSGNEKSFDKLVCFWMKNQSQYSSLIRLIKIKILIYLLHPLHFYRMVRDVIIKPLF